MACAIFFAVEKNDAQLIGDYLEGDEEALEVLIEQHLKSVYRFVFRLVGGNDAQDITQEVFERMWKSLKQFDRMKDFKPWLFSIAKNASLDFLRKRRIASFSEYEDDQGNNPVVDTLADASPLPDELLRLKDIDHTLNEAIFELPPKQRMVLSLYYENHLNLREIAEALEEPIDTVKSRHLRALAALRGRLTNYS